MVEVKILSVRLPKADSFELLCAARAAGVTVSDIVRAALAPIIRPSHDTTADTAETTLALPATKLPYTGKGQHDDFARAAVAARQVEASRSAKLWLTVNEHANPSNAVHEQARSAGLLLD